jgi:hypothetical protein
MAFGQATGSPATGKQVRELLELLQAAGHADFRDARGPMGFTQRQAAGKFTRDEAQAFIDQLEAEAHGRPDEGDAPPAAVAAPRARPAAAPAKAAPAAPARTAPVLRLTPNERAVRAVTDKELLAEVRRRGLTLEP